MPLLGPVFEVEARLHARRRRTYVLRALFGLALLGFAWSMYEDARNWVALRTEFGPAYRRMAAAAARVFWNVLILQWVVLVAATPAVVAGAVATDRQRGILLNLLASPLSSREIVLGKLAARTLMAFSLFLVGLPILAIVGLLGGIEPEHLVSSFLAMIALLWMLSAMSILVSVHSRKARDAVFVSYLLVAAWLIAPSFLRPLLTIWWTGLEPYGMPILRALELSGPTELVALVSRPVERGRTLYLLVGLEFLVGVLAAGLATWRLRRVSAEPEAVGARGSSKGRFRLFRRPRCGDDPMMWKELRVARMGRGSRIACWLIGAPLMAVTVEATSGLAGAAFREVLDEGYGWSETGYNDGRDRFNKFLRYDSATVLTVWLLAVTTAAAGSVTSEREEDTWISLRSTPLGERAILRAKLLGSLRRFWPLGAMLAGMWTLGLVCGAVHPLAFPFVAVDLVVSSLFVAAVGVCASAVARSTARAMLLAVGVLLATNLVPLFAAAYFETMNLFAFTTMPTHPIVLGLSDDDLRRMRHADVVVVALAGTTLHAAGIPILIQFAAESLTRKERPSRG